MKFKIGDIVEADWGRDDFTAIVVFIRSSRVAPYLIRIIEAREQNHKEGTEWYKSGRDLKFPERNEMTEFKVGDEAIYTGGACFVESGTRVIIDKVCDGGYNYHTIEGQRHSCWEPEINFREVTPKFKVGDRVKLSSYAKFDDYRRHLNEIAEIYEMTGDSMGIKWGDGSTSRVRFDVYWPKVYKVNESDKGERKVKERRTFKQLVEGFETRKGSVWQEKCDDGDQEYVLLHREDITPDDWDTYFDWDEEDGIRMSRHTVENNPQWFVEVFRTSKEWYTAGELEIIKEAFSGKLSYKPKVQAKKKTVVEEKLEEVVETNTKPTIIYGRGDYNMSAALRSMKVGDTHYAPIKRKGSVSATLAVIKKDGRDFTIKPNTKNVQVVRTK